MKSKGQMKYEQAKKMMIDEILEMSDEYTRSELEEMSLLFLEVIIRELEEKKHGSKNNNLKPLE